MNRIFLLLSLGLLAGAGPAFSNELLLIANKGQVKFPDGQVAKEILYTLSDKNGSLHLRRDGWDYYQYRSLSGADSNKIFAAKMSCRFSGINPAALVQEGAVQQYSERYYANGNGEGAIYAHSLKEYRIKNLYPGIDYHVYLSGNGIKYDLEIAAGADAGLIKWTYSGDISIQSQESGSLLINGPLGSLEEKAPLSFRSGTRQLINSRYKVLSPGLYTFELEDGAKVEYARTIDPYISWTTFYGGSGLERIYGVERTEPNTVFASGNTTSPNNISFSGYQDTIAGLTDIFVLRMNDQGQRIWCSYYGASEQEFFGRMLFRDKTNFYICGITQSTGFHTRGSKQPGSNDYDILLMRMDTSGRPYWVRCIGSDSSELVESILFSPDSQSLYIAGQTTGDDAMINSLGKTSYNATLDGYLLKLDTAGALIWSRLYAGTSPMDGPYDVKIAPNGNIATVFRTLDTTMGTSNSFRQMPNGKGIYHDHLLSMFDSAGNVVWAGYLGGEAQEVNAALLFDELGSLYMAGTTSSKTGIAFNAGSRQSTQMGNFDIYLSRLDTSGKLFWSFYIGGTGNEYAMELTRNGNDAIYLCGRGSNPAVFSGGFMNSANSNRNGLLLRLDTNGSIRWGSFFGSHNTEEIHSFQVNDNRLLVGGNTNGTSFFGSHQSHQTTNGGVPWDGFILVAVENLPYSNFLFDSVYCTGDLLNLPFEIADSVGSNNTVRLQLSDSSGSFANPTLLQSKSRSALGNDSLTFTLPRAITTSGQYRIRLTTSSPADTFLFNQIIRINQAPTAAIQVNDTSFCRNEQAFQWVNQTLSPFVYREFGFGDGQVNSGADTVDHSYAQTGKYTSYVLAKNGFGCIDSAWQEVEVYAVPVAGFNLPASALCSNTGPLTFSNTSTGYQQLSWYFGDGDSSIALHPQHSYPAGTYEVRLVLGNSLNCFDTANRIIVVHDPATAQINPDASIFCPGDSTLFRANCDAFSKVSWYIGAQFLDSACALIVKDSLLYTLIRTDANACRDTTTQKVGLYPAVQVPLIQQSWDTLKTAPGYTEYTWYLNGQVLSSGPQNSIVATQNGNYTVSVKDGNGCSKESAIYAMLNVRLVDARAQNIVVYPNPVKDELIIETGSLEDGSLLIYNALGQLCLRQLVRENGPQKVNVESLAPGVYTLVAESQAGNTRVKFVVE